MNKETVGLVVSLGLLFVGYFWATTHYATQNSPAPVPTLAATVVSAAAAVSTPLAPLTASLIPEIQPIAPANPEDLLLKSAQLEMTFSQQGGCVAEARLPQFKKAVGSNESVSVFTNYDFCKAFGFRLGDVDLRSLPSVVKRESESKVRFVQSVGNLEISRAFELNKEGFQGRMSVDVRNLAAVEQQTSLQFSLGARSEIQGAGGMFSSHRPEGENLAYFVDDKVHRFPLPFKDNPSAETLATLSGAKPQWLSTGTMYFLSAVLPVGNNPLNFSLRQVGSVIAKDAQSPSDQTVYEAWVEQPLKIAPNGIKSFEYDLFIGPKIKRELDKFQGKDLAKSVDFGFFSVVSWPLFYALDFIHKLVKNWGVAIIILTALVKMVLYPLARKSYVSMKKMQKIQPELKALQEKYKDDKQKLNQETMAFMSQKGANPLSGCLPLLPQLPIFFGLYSVFQQTFELRQAPFFFWIHDLSVMDPYFVLPILIAILYYVQQKLTPMAPGMDPVQQKMMKILPFVFSLMMITFPSGLALYICTNTVLSIAQQWYMIKKYKDV